MKKGHIEKMFASKFRNFIVEFFAVFSIVAANGTFLVLILTDVIGKNFGKSYIALIGALYLLFSCTLSTALIYFVKGRVYHDKIRLFSEAAASVAKGNFSVRVPVLFDKPKSEMDYLTYNFNKMVSELSSLENMKNDFVADVSHEIKTPLSVIQGYADLLRKEGLSETERHEYVTLISEAIHSLTTLVTNILKLNKIENQQILKKENFYLDELVCSCLLNYEDAVSEKDIEIKTQLPEMIVFSDKALLEIVLNNLFSNAVKFTDKNGEIGVELSRKGKNVEIIVKDNGCGMNRETQKRIFDKFYQGDTSHSQSGNGLGLAIVDKVVALLESDISVKSKEGKGAEFRILLKNV